MTEDEGHQSIAEAKADLDALQNRMSRLQELRKVAQQKGDRQMAEQLKRQIDELREQYRKHSLQLHKDKEKSTGTLSRLLGKKKT